MKMDIAKPRPFFFFQIFTLKAKSLSTIQLQENVVWIMALHKLARALLLGL